jgi:hypothetical protein
MRLSTLLAAGFAGASLALASPARAQVSIGISVYAPLGPALRVYAYSPEREGEWRDDYMRWSPVVVYEDDGHYYRRRGRGARPVVVYMYRGAYFFPPRDRAWQGYDRRYDYDRQPVYEERSRGRGRGHEHGDDGEHGRGRGRGHDDDGG